MRGRKNNILVLVSWPMLVQADENHANAAKNSASPAKLVGDVLRLGNILLSAKKKYSLHIKRFANICYA